MGLSLITATNGLLGSQAHRVFFLKMVIIYERRDDFVIRLYRKISNRTIRGSFLPLLIVW